MKIILTLSREDPGDPDEAREYVAALTRTIERRRYREMPGALLSQEDASIWVSGVELVEDAS